MGGTELSIFGKYLYSDKKVPAKIEVAGVPCKVTNFERNNQVDSKLTCMTGLVSSPAELAEYAGNRGINLIIEDGLFVNFANLENAKSTNASVYKTIDSTSIWVNYFNIKNRKKKKKFSLDINQRILLIQKKLFG